MDLTIRDWMVIVGILLILAVLLDAWRRIRSEKYSRVKMDSLEPEPEAQADSPEPDDEFAMFRELPNGGARVVERGDLLRAAGVDYTDPPESANAEVSGMTAGDKNESMDWLDGLDSTSGSPKQPAAGKLLRAEQPEVFMLNVVARSPRGFRGEEILHILLACDLRFGDMSFFHRHEMEAGRGPIQFSVANMMQPGVFDIDNMADMTTPGLVFFLTLPGPDDMMKAFDYMLETAQAVSRNLGGDVLDESRSALTRQSMDHCRHSIRDLERRLLAQAR